MPRKLRLEFPGAMYHVTSWEAKGRKSTVHKRLDRLLSACRMASTFPETGNPAFEDHWLHAGFDELNKAISR
jgi:hypothetical protein